MRMRVSAPIPCESLEPARSTITDITRVARIHRKIAVPGESHKDRRGPQSARPEERVLLLSTMSLTTRAHWGWRRVASAYARL